MRQIALLAAFAGALILSGCNEQKTAAVPPPQEMTDLAIGRYCGMNVMEHPGPKGQIILASQKEAVWFSSARDAISFTLLPEEPKDIRAIYVSDMAKAPNWEEPGPTRILRDHPGLRSARRWSAWALAMWRSMRTGSSCQDAAWG